MKPHCYSTKMTWFALLFLLFSYFVYSDGSCGGRIYVESTTPFHSPNYPDKYNASTTCTWTIDAPTSQQIKLHFEMFELESHDRCQFDALEIRDGSTRQSPLLGKFCGSTIPLPLISSTNHLYITFNSDGSEHKDGFRAFFLLAVVVCNSSQFKCALDDLCISSNLMCDGKKDCPSGEDEILCTDVVCNSSQFRCAQDDLCISSKLLCDGKTDCPSGADEILCNNCNTTKLSIPHAEVNHSCVENLEVAHLLSVNVVCAKGFTMETMFHNSVLCVNGNWTNIPKCVPSCAAPMHLPENVQLIEPYKTTYLHGEHAFLNCSIGYFFYDGFISPTVMITCKGNDSWMPYKIQCIQKNHFHIIYKPQPVEIVQAEVGQNLTLSCDLKTQLHSSKDPQLSFQWLKGTVDVKSLLNIYFTVTAEGNLVLLNVSAEYAGMYSCLQMDQLKYLTPSKVTYIVKMKSACLPPPTNFIMTVQQNISIVLFCPLAGSEFQDPPVWYNTKGERIFNDGKYSLISNTGLLLKSVSYSDQGLHICDLGPNTLFCERRFTTNLQVIPTNEDICGISQKNGTFPWLVTLWWDDDLAPICYGTLVNERWVVTTAFCLNGVRRKRIPDIFVKLGQQNLQGSMINSTMISVEFTKTHPQYSMRINIADIGVVKLKTPVAYSDDITPICFSSEDFKTVADSSSCDPPAPIRGQVSGLGSLEAELKPPEAECVEVVMAETCHTSSIPPESVCCTQSCESTPKAIADYGSPFQIEHNGKMHLYSIFSWHDRQTSHDYFTIVHPYYKWIKSYVNRKD